MSLGNDCTGNHYNTTQKMKFSIQDFFSKYDQFSMLCDYKITKFTVFVTGKGGYGCCGGGVSVEGMF